MAQVDILKTLKGTCEGWIYEYKFDFERRFKFDYANLRLKIAIEMEGGIYTGTGHAKTGRYLKDMEKYNMAAIKGWIILRYAYGQEKKIAGDVKKAIEKRRSDIAFKDEIEKVEKGAKVERVEKSEKLEKK
jgi:hypothetical protein